MKCDHYVIFKGSITISLANLLSIKQSIFCYGGTCDTFKAVSRFCIFREFGLSRENSPATMVCQLYMMRLFLREAQKKINRVLQWYNISSEKACRHVNMKIHHGSKLGGLSPTTAKLGGAGAPTAPYFSATEYGYTYSTYLCIFSSHGEIQTERGLITVCTQKSSHKVGRPPPPPPLPFSGSLLLMATTVGL